MQPPRRDRWPSSAANSDEAGTIPTYHRAFLLASWRWWRAEEDATTAPWSEESASLRLVWRPGPVVLASGVGEPQPEEQIARFTSSGSSVGGGVGCRWDSPIRFTRSPRNAGLLKPYKPKKPQSHEAEITRGVQQLLNVVSPENMSRIVERFEGIVIQGPKDLELMISLVIRKVLDEPHYCETYADLVYSLRSRYPEFPPDQDGERATTFARVLITAVQSEWEGHKQSVLEAQGLSASDIPIAEVCERQDAQRKRALANMKFIGHLFLRKLLAEKVINFVLSELLSGAEEHNVECACQLLQVIGHMIEATPSGQRLVSDTSARLLDLRDVDTLSKRLRYKIQDLLDLKRRGWQEKVLREQAKTIEEVHRDAAAEFRRGCRGGAAGRTDVKRASFGRQGSGPKDPDNINGGGSGTPARVPKAPVLEQPPEAKPLEGGSSMEIILDSAGVRRLFSYFAEERDPESLVRDWQRARLPAAFPTWRTEAPEQAACRSLLEVGVNTGTERLQELCAEAVAVLIAKGAVSRTALGAALSPLLGDLAEVVLDAPHAIHFLEHLLARLLLGDNDYELDVAILEALPGPLIKPEEGNVHVWTLLLGTLRQVKDWGGPQLAQRAASRRQISAALRTAGCCSRRRLAQILESEGIVRGQPQDAAKADNVQA